jgi:hypothetical protein
MAAAIIWTLDLSQQFAGISAGKRGSAAYGSGVL